MCYEYTVVEGKFFDASSLHAFPQKMLFSTYFFKLKVYPRGRSYYQAEYKGMLARVG
jgi:hypothetical protein